MAANSVIVIFKLSVYILPRNADTPETDLDNIHRLPICDSSFETTLRCTQHQRQVQDCKITHALGNIA